MASASELVAIDALRASASELVAIGALRIRIVYYDSFATFEFTDSKGERAPFPANATLMSTGFGMTEGATGWTPMSVAQRPVQDVVTLGYNRTYELLVDGVAALRLAARTRFVFEHLAS